MNAITPNLFAYLMLFSWPLLSLFLYYKKSLVPATIWTILAGQLVLPVGTIFKLEMIPQFDKNSIPSLCALIGCILVAKMSLRVRRKFSVAEVAICSYVALPVITSILNGDPVRIGGTILPGVGLYDGFSALLSQLLTLVPFFLGRRFLRNSSSSEELLRTVAVAGLAYSIPLLFEIRFSPQLNFWFYGYYPSDFVQEMRGDGGFRPMVFMGHGLLASFFVMISALACATLWRTRVRVFGTKGSFFTLYLSLVLYLCKSGAALIYGAMLVPLVRWTTSKTQMRVAVLLASLALVYPVLRIGDIFPTHSLVEISASIDSARARSLEFRFDQEDALLQRAWQRVFFGWGRYGRNRVFKENWEGIGTDSSVTDGRWIITFGQFGIFGFLAEFGLLAIPIFSASRVLKLLPLDKEALFLAAVGLIVAINMIDLLPNSTLSPFTWLLAGSLLGRSEAIRVHAQHSRRSANASAQKAIDFIGRKAQVA